jgi:hypothetical protein
MHYELLTWEMYGKSNVGDYETITSIKHTDSDIDLAKIRELKKVVRTENGEGDG